MLPFTTPQTFTKWLREEKIPKAENVQMLADFFGVPVDYLLQENIEVPHDDGLRADERKVLELYRRLRDRGEIGEGGGRWMRRWMQRNRFASDDPKPRVEPRRGDITAWGCCSPPLQGGIIMAESS